MANCANTVSVFGRVDGVEGTDQYVFFYADSDHPAFTVVKNIVPAQMYVAEFSLVDYPVAAEDILHTGEAAFSAALNTVNIGKFNLCFGGIGMSTHALYETITHAHNRILFGNPVTAFPHVRREFVDAYARLLAMRLFSDRAVDYFRTASPEDRPLPLVQSRHQDEGDNRGTEGDRTALRHRCGKGLRERTATSRWPRWMSTGCPSSRGPSPSISP